MFIRSVDLHESVDNIEGGCTDVALMIYEDGNDSSGCCHSRSKLRNIIVMPFTDKQ